MVEFVLPVAGLEAEIEIISIKRGGKDVPALIRISPYFFSAEGRGTLCHLQTYNQNGDLVNRKLLRQSGRTGNVTLMDRSLPISPAFETQAMEAKEEEKS